MSQEKVICTQLQFTMTYKWNLINKINKQNITRDIEINNKLTVTREKWGGVLGTALPGFRGCNPP